MVDANNLKVYFSENGGLGGDIDTDNQVLSNNPNNAFENIPSDVQAAGGDFYLCNHFKNTHGSESMENFKLWLAEKKKPGDTSLKWALDPAAMPGGYRYKPWFDATGSTFNDTASSSSLQLPKWCISGWFRTSANYTTEGMIVNKGGIGSDTAGQNMNYGIWMNSAEKIVCGFEEADGTDHFITSPLTYNDGHWHFFVADFSTDTGNIRLFIDNMTSPVASTNVGSDVPETTGTNPVRVGANSRASDRFFNGDIDEVRIWDRASTEDKRNDLKLYNKVNTAGIKLELKFGTDTGRIVAQEIDNFFDPPTNVSWLGVDQEPDDPNFGRLVAGGNFPIWLWRHNDPGAVSRLSDSGTFFFEFDVPSGGTTTTGGGGEDGSSGGSGGNTTTVSNFKIAIVGDEGCGSDTNKVRDKIKSNGYQLVVSVGDHAYDDPDCWINTWDDIRSIFKVSAWGNHEYDDGGSSEYKAFFGISSKVSNAVCYTYKFRNLFFLVVDTNKDFDPGSDQHDFIKSELSRIRNDSSIHWKLAVMHHPWFGTGSKHPFNEDNQIEAFHELFNSNDVAWLFTGHNHNWSRSKQLQFNDGDEEDPDIVDSSSPFDGTKGLIEVRSGTGGHDDEDDLYDLGSLSSQPYIGFQNNTHLGFYEIAFTNGGKTATGRFIESGGNTFDTITVTMP